MTQQPLQNSEDRAEKASVRPSPMAIAAGVGPFTLTRRPRSVRVTEGRSARPVMERPCTYMKGKVALGAACARLVRYDSSSTEELECPIRDPFG